MTKLNRPIIYLIAVLLIGLAVIWLERPGAGPRDDTQVIRFYPNLDVAKVQKLQISHLMTGVTLTRDGAGWTATTTPTRLSQEAEALGQSVATPQESLPADPKRVAGILDTLKTVESRSLISRDASVTPQMEVNEVGTRVQAYDASGQALVDIYLGKTGPDLVTTYARRAGEPMVYLVKGYLTAQFPADVKAWKKTEETKK